MKELEVTDDQYRTLVTVLDLVSDADSGSDAVWFSEYGREQIDDVRAAINEQEEEAAA